MCVYVYEYVYVYGYVYVYVYVYVYASQSLHLPSCTFTASETITMSDCEARHPAACSASGTQKQCLDLDQMSVASTGVMTQTSKTHGRRDRRRQLAEQRDSRPLPNSAASVPKAMQDAAVQCQIDGPSEADTDLRLKMQRLKKKLNETRLKVVALKGEVASYRRIHGEQSDEEWWGCSSASSSSSTVTEASSESHRTPIPGDDTEEHADAHQVPAAELQDDSDADSLDNNIEIGNVAMAKGLTSERGQELNGYYGKVVTYNAQSRRFGIKIKGDSLALKEENLEMGMKMDEMSGEDEKLLLGLQPAKPELLALPRLDRIRAVEESRRQQSPVSS